MQNGWSTTPSALTARRVPLRLVTVNGRIIDAPPALPRSAPLDAPEDELTVEFVGISAEEQEAALAAFPGGRRFRLTSAPN
jgi:hypothetical protein